MRVAPELCNFKGRSTKNTKRANLKNIKETEKKCWHYGKKMIKIRIEKRGEISL